MDTNKSTSDLKEIIELCKTNGIRHFKSSELELHFKDDSLPLVNSDVELQKEAKRIKTELIQDLLLEDPLAYEEALNRNE